MITLNAAYARMKRQKIEEFAGESFLHRDSIIMTIPYLEKYADQQFLFGIYLSKDTWTILSVNYLYAAYYGKREILRLDTEANEILNYFRSNVFSANVHLGDGRRIWLKSSEFCSLFLNILLMLEKVPCGTVLEA